MWTTNILLPLLSLLLLFIVSLLRCFSQVDPLDCFVAHVVCCFVASLLQGAWRGGSTGMSSSFHYSWCPFCAVVSVGHCWTSLSSVLSINIQVSWHGRRWWKELGDPEKGFYGWVRSCKTKFFSNRTIRRFVLSDQFSGLQPSQPSRLFSIPGAKCPQNIFPQINIFQVVILTSSAEDPGTLTSVI